MSAGVVIFTLLNNNVTVTGLTGARIFPDVSPQKALRPAIIYSEISRIPTNTSGVGGVSSLDISRIQITIGATTRKQAETIGNAVRAALDDVNNTTVSGYYVDWIRFDSAYGYFDQISDQDGLYLLNQDYKITIRQ